MTGFRERIRTARRHFNLTTPEIFSKWGCVYGHCQLQWGPFWKCYYYLCLTLEGSRNKAMRQNSLSLCLPFWYPFL